MIIKIRRNAARHLLDIKGQSWNLHELDSKQKDAICEMLVDYWCKQKGYAPIYGGTNE